MKVILIEDNVEISYSLSHAGMARNAHLNSEGESISTADHLVLAS